MSERFIERYKKGDAPWDIGRPDFNLVDTVTDWPIQSCKALEIGCGSGTNSVWLARQKFPATGLDVSEIIIEKARANAEEAGVECTFSVLDFMDNEVHGAPFGFVFDRGCFHSFESDAVRKNFAEKVADHLDEGGLWLSIIGSDDDEPRDTGPPRLTAKDIVSAVEPYFEILSLKSSRFESDRLKPPKAWVCLMRKRNRP